MMNDLMIDLETMDNLPSAAIVSIGVAQCNLITGETGETFYRVVDLEGQQEKGLTISPSTIYWWMKQNDSARRALSQDQKITLEDMCDAFQKFFNYINGNGNFRLWGNGASFDNAIIRHAFGKLNKDFPIPFWNDRDMRTIVGFYPRQLQADWKRENFRKGTHHNALDDALYQIKFCSHILQELGVEELY